MNNKLLSLQHLETLSSADLISIADDYGIDIPENLNRRFIIGELLEIGEELDETEKSAEPEIVEDETLEEKMKKELPSTFNETEIQIVLRNPAWAYVYWDISSPDLKSLDNGSSKNSSFSRFSRFVLRVSYFENKDDLNPAYFFDINVDKSTREQFVLLKNNGKFLRIDLVALFDDGSSDNLAVSRKVKLPLIPEIIKNAKPGTEIHLPPLVRLSGMKNLLEISYEKYRASFED